MHAPEHTAVCTHAVSPHGGVIMHQNMHTPASYPAPRPTKVHGCIRPCTSAPLHLLMQRPTMQKCTSVHQSTPVCMLVQRLHLQECMHTKQHAPLHACMLLTIRKRAHMDAFACSRNVSPYKSALGHGHLHACAISHNARSAQMCTRAHLQACLHSVILHRSTCISPCTSLHTRAMPSAPRNAHLHPHATPHHHHPGVHAGSRVHASAQLHI